MSHIVHLRLITIDGFCCDWPLIDQIPSLNILKPWIIQWRSASWLKVTYGRIHICHTGGEVSVFNHVPQQEINQGLLWRENEARASSITLVTRGLTHTVVCYPGN